MKRDKSPRPNSAVTDPLRRWSGSLTAEKSSWHQQGASPGFRVGTLIVLVPSLLVALALLIACLLTEALFVLVAALRGVQYTAFIHWGQTIWFLVFGAGGAVSVMLAIMLAAPTVVSFEFDIGSHTFVYAESRMGRGMLVTTSPFESVVSVRPLLMTTYAVDGGFEISLRRQDGSVLAKHMGDGIPLDELRTHAVWLKRELGDRVEPTLQLDT